MIEGDNEYLPNTVKERRILNTYLVLLKKEWKINEGRNVKDCMMNERWMKDGEYLPNIEWRNEYLPRTVMTVGMKDECRNESKKYVKEENDYLPSMKWM